MASSVHQRSKRRSKDAYRALPEQLPRATEFTDDPQLCDPVWILAELKRHPDVLDDLLEATDLSQRYGRPRLPGKWALIMLAFTLSGEVDVESFCNRYRTSQIWQVAEFTAMPTPQTVWNRLTELEAHSQAFIDAANKLIGRANKHEPRIGRWLWVDGSAFHTHAALEHCCTDREACKALPGRTPAVHMPKASDELVTESRHEEAEEAPADETPGAIEEITDTMASRGRPPKRRRPYVFRHWRDRYSVAGNSDDSRPKRPGIKWQNLRSSAALLLEWFRLSLRHGWLGSHSRINQAPAYELKPGNRLQATLASRRKKLDRPYGKAAKKWLASGGGRPPDEDDVDDSKLPF